MEIGDGKEESVKADGEVGKLNLEAVEGDEEVEEVKEEAREEKSNGDEVEMGLLSLDFSFSLSTLVKGRDGIMFT